MTHHTHTWEPTDTGWECVECDATCASCVVYRHNDPNAFGHPTGTSLLICDPCLAAERRILDDIETARDSIAPDPPSPITSYAYDLANRGGGGKITLPFDMDRFVDDWALGIAGIKTADGIDELMLEWVARWTEHAGADNSPPAEYLRTHLMWAAHHPDESAWADYRDEMRKLLARARALDPHSPVRTGEDCIDCGGPLVRRWRRDGLGDDVACLACERHYDVVSFRLAVRDRHERAAQVSPGTLVTEAEATTMLDLGVGTVRQWVARGVLARVQTRPARYRLGDVRAVRDRGVSERVDA